VQYLFHRLVDAEHRQRSLSHAVETFNIPSERPFHYAADDAFYTAQVLSKLIQVATDQGMDLETMLRRYSWNPNLDYSFKDTQPFNRSPKAVPVKLTGEPVVCPACRRKLVPKGQIKWKKKRKHYVATAMCPDHGAVTGRVSFGRLNGKVPELHFHFSIEKYGE